MSTGVIEDAVIEMMKHRNEILQQGSFLDPDNEWKITITLSGDVGFDIYVAENLFDKFLQTGKGESDWIKTLVTYMYSLIECELFQEEDEDDIIYTVC